MSKPYMKIDKDFTKQFNAIIKKFRHDDVLVGIPEDDDERKETEESAPIGNAALLAITNFGSPMNNIPAWPVMSIGIRNAQDEIADQFKLCAQDTLTAALTGRGSGFEALDKYYNRAGIIASVAIKKVINEQEDAPELSNRTIATRRALGFKGDKRGIVTGQMRNAITYVVRGA